MGGASSSWGAHAHANSNANNHECSDVNSGTPMIYAGGGMGHVRENPDVNSGTPMNKFRCRVDAEFVTTYKQLECTKYREEKVHTADVSFEAVETRSFPQHAKKKTPRSGITIIYN